MPRFQFEGKTDVWIGQVRRVKCCGFGSCGFLPGVIPHIFGTKVGNSCHSDDDRSVASFNPAKKHVGICNKTFRFYGWKLNQWEREIYIV